MPRMTPQGVLVPTLPEFFQAEAEREGQGRNGLDLMNEMFYEMNQDMEQERASMKRPEVALEQIRGAIRWNNGQIRRRKMWYMTTPAGRQYLRRYPEQFEEKRLPLPKKVVKVLIAEYGYNLSSSQKRILAIAIDQYDRLCVYELNSWDSRGSYYEPPDGEEEIDFWLIPRAAH